MSNVDRGHEKEISGKIAAQMEKGGLNASSLRDELEILQAENEAKLKAEESRRKAQFEAESSYNTAQKYFEEFDYKNACKYYKKAADLGHVEAQYSLGNMYKYGKGIKQDFRNAYMWFCVAEINGFNIDSARDTSDIKNS